MKWFQFVFTVTLAFRYFAVKADILEVQQFIEITCRSARLSVRLSVLMYSKVFSLIAFLLTVGVTGGNN